MSLAHLTWSTVATLAVIAAPEGDDAAVPASQVLSADDARSALQRGLGYLVSTQNEDGSWARPTIESLFEEGFALESFYAWQMASQALACMALARCEETAERRAALEKGLTWLTDSRLPKRGSHWDIDYVWTMLYGFVACVELVQDERFSEGPWHERLETRGRAFYDLLETHQSINGGWAYYDSPPYPAHPIFDASFSTALVLPALETARELGWPVDPAVTKRAVEYVIDCALPNGAYAYRVQRIPRFSGESVNAVKGSLGRIQVCNWALRNAGIEWITDEKLREGVAAFFEHHAFLDVARMKPIPHEAYYANAGYFYFFGHYYAALAIELLPEAERDAWHRELRWHLVKTQGADGSNMDFQGGGYLRVASTAFTLLALEAGLAR